MNILVCSVGRRVQLINYFKEELNKIGGKVVAVGCDPTFPALYYADIYKVVPRIDHPEYISCIKEICHKYKIKGILPLIDSELRLLSRYKKELQMEGIQVIVSDKKVIETCNDKYLTSKFLIENNIASVPTYNDIEVVLQDLATGKLQFPIIVKPADSNGGIGLHKVTNLNNLRELWEQNNGLIAQPFIDGVEYCVECYIDTLTNEPINLFSKRKLNMRAGETDKAIAVKDSKLYEITFQLIDALKPSGPIDIDFFKTDNGYILSEINPRFGGGYPYAYQLGENFIESIINNLKGVPNEPLKKYLGEYVEGKIMTRFDQYIIL